MTLMPSGSGGARPALDDLIQLLARSGAGASPYGGSGQPAGLFGSGYRAFMARQAPGQISAAGMDAAAPDGASTPAAFLSSGGDFDWAPVVRAASAGRGANEAPGAVQLASNDARCPTCHSALPPPSPPPPSLHLPETLQTFLGLPMGADALPPPFSGLATAGQVAGALSGPQVSQFVPPRDPPVPPGSGAAGDSSKYPKGCVAQANFDEERCSLLPLPTTYARARARECCWRSMNNRWAYCTNPSTLGEVGSPPLMNRWSKSRDCYPTKRYP